jgi:aldehyde dehydrogenase (NAD+)
MTIDILTMRHPFLDNKPKRMLIDGKWVEAASGKTFESINPSTGEIMARVAEGDSEDIDRAVDAARRAFNGPWSKFKPRNGRTCCSGWLTSSTSISRSRRLSIRWIWAVRSRAPYVGGHASSGSCVTTLARPSRSIARRSRTRFPARSSASPSRSRSAWSAPSFRGTARLAWPVARSAAPWRPGVLLVLKPAEQTPLMALRLAELCLEAGVPPGVVNVVPGYGETAGAALAAHMDVDKVAFTESHFTGQEIVKASAGNLKRLQLELGGKSPDVVFADADIEAAVPGAAMAVFSNSGQICSAGTRMFVERKGCFNTSPYCPGCVPDAADIS